MTTDCSHTEPLSDSVCYVCRRPFHPTDVPHTHHAEGCPWRDPDNDGNPADPCAELTGCGEDVHADCCPTCNWTDDAE